MKSKVISKSSYKYWLSSFICLSLLALVSQDAAAGGGMSIGGMASTITSSFTNLTKLITAGSYLAGLGFSIGAIMKFKQHKDNPTQIPIGTPIALVFIAAALLFLPSILGVTGVTMFGGSGGSTAGPTGTVYTSGS
ncbi:type IV secretion protein IcmD [Legionella qingyii]|uniref:Type IV secretion protein IcmD n=1 Tax=Legionella qingyii TaxID=2184757 RepID=A0A317U6N7_9GAMM|nr:type IV secretion protein IcmD [Legionella qingyii]PWY56965.1 type IV secretion protein IcmD [Legionella qingyii]RUR24394.1 type IV secretion protein IcmD [Legionella qingyii]RUR27043.1 type IV secretion protein IcmD [Legionella qingyii]